MSGIGYKAHGDRIAKASRLLIKVENLLKTLYDIPPERRDKKWKSQVGFLEDLLLEK